MQVRASAAPLRMPRNECGRGMHAGWSWATGEPSGRSPIGRPHAEGSAVAPRLDLRPDEHVADPELGHRRREVGIAPLPGAHGVGVPYVEPVGDLLEAHQVADFDLPPHDRRTLDQPTFSGGDGEGRTGWPSRGQRGLAGTCGQPADGHAPVRAATNPGPDADRPMLATSPSRPALALLPGRRATASRVHPEAPRC